MNSCPECNADKKYNYTEPLGGDVVGYHCGAVTIRVCPENEPLFQKKCDYRPPKEMRRIIGIDLGAGESKSVFLNPETGLPEIYNVSTYDEIKERFEELYRRHALE